MGKELSKPCGEAVAGFVSGITKNLKIKRKEKLRHALKKFLNPPTYGVRNQYPVNFVRVSFHIMEFLPTFDAAIILWRL